MSFAALKDRSVRVFIAATTVVCAASAVTAVVSGSANAAGDPRGANGTIKIDGVTFDTGIDNEPHVGCRWAVRFFNFDKDERADITFAGQAPTGKDQVLLTEKNLLISNDAAAGGKPDPDEVRYYTSAQLGLDGIEPHPKQGFHVKLTVDILGEPGAGKHKVYWLQPCEATTPTPTPTESEYVS